MHARVAMSLRLSVACAAAVAATILAAYLTASTGIGILPGVAVACGLLIGLALQRQLATIESPPDAVVQWAWGLVVIGAVAVLLWPTWPALLPPGGASDLTHHLMLVDVLERTRSLVEGTTSEVALGEMAHYTPGLHLLIVIAGSLVGVDGYRTAYPLLALTVALKAGFLFLIAHDLLAGVRSRVPIAAAAVGFVLYAPRAYSLDGFLQAGFYPQVASELFVVAGWWALARWWAQPGAAWIGFVGLMGAAVFLVWPIWIGPLMLAAAAAILFVQNLTWGVRLRSGALAVVPFLVVAALHLSQHAAWLRIAGTSGAVPALTPGALGWGLLLLAGVGAVAIAGRAEARVTLWLIAAIAFQCLALWLLARARGADTPYMAMKMIYLAVYPVAVLAAVGLAVMVQRLRAPAIAVWGATGVILALGLGEATASPVPPPLVNVDLDAAGRWVRDNLPASCVDYVVDNAEQAYWLHLAVMGQPRSSPRTADIDAYSANRAVGRWVEGSALPYAIARRELLPGEVLREAALIRTFGSAVVLKRSGVGCPVPTGN